MKLKYLFFVLLLIGLILVSGCTQENNQNIQEKNKSQMAEQKIEKNISQDQGIQNNSEKDILKNKSVEKDQVLQTKLTNVKGPGYAELVDVSNGIVG